jgi:hypothetical protein
MTNKPKLNKERMEKESKGNSSLKVGVKNGIKIMKQNPLEVPEVARKPQPKYSLEILKEFPELHKWLEELSRYRKLEDYIYISDYKKEEGKIRLKIFTKEYYYTIVAIRPNNKKPEGYLGTYANCRKPRAGEEWTRGNDLPDGEYKRETWDRFVASLVSYELVKVVRNSPGIDEK